MNFVSFLIFPFAIFPYAKKAEMKKEKSHADVLAIPPPRKLFKSDYRRQKKALKINEIKTYLRPCLDAG